MKTLSSDRTVITAANPDWDLARRAWNLTVDQRPALIAVPETAADVAAAVRYAAGRGLRVAAQGTGHGAAPLGDLADTVLIKTHKMRGLVIDPVGRTARAEAGVPWREVTDAAAAHGLAALAGTGPDVGVVGYTLGGGISWLSRTYGLSANNVQAIEAVLASGELVRADAYHELDLFWALRGGGGSFAVVTAIELRLFPVTEVYAGLLCWPATQAAPVLHAWRELTGAGLPDEFTTSAIDADWFVFAGGLAPDPAGAASVAGAVGAVKRAMAPWAARQTYLNITETSTDPARFFDPDAYARLRRVKAAVDPADRVRSNHPIPL